MLRVVLGHSRAIADHAIVDTTVTLVVLAVTADLDGGVWHTRTDLRFEIFRVHAPPVGRNWTVARGRASARANAACWVATHAQPRGAVLRALTRSAELRACRRNGRVVCAAADGQEYEKRDKPAEGAGDGARTFNTRHDTPVGQCNRKPCAWSKQLRRPRSYRPSSSPPGKCSWTSR